MLTAPSQVIVRNNSLLSTGKWLLVNPTDADIFDALPEVDILGFHQYFDIYQQASSGINADHHLFAASYPVNHQIDGAIIYMPKAKEHAKMLIANIAASIKPGGQLLIVGENKTGVKSAANLLERVSTQVNKIDSARHCSLYCAQLDKPVDEFSLTDWITHYSCTIAGKELTVANLPGVFSANELDPATRLLLDNLPKKLTGKVLDFACGAGVIGCGIAKSFPDVTLTMTDVNAIALHCALLTAENNNISATVLPSDGLSQVNGKFDFIATNPPFHSGIKTDYTVTEEFVGAVKQHLSNNGRLLLVANRFLPYPDVIKTHLGHAATLAQTSKFNLYQSSV